jgi:hypothetical protein
LTDLVLVEWLRQVVERAELERLDRGVDGPVRGDHDDRELGVLLYRFAEERHPVDLRHLQVGDDEIDVVLSQEREPLLAVLCEEHVIAVARQLGGEDLSQIRLVVDDQDLLLLREHGGPSLSRVAGYLLASSRGHERGHLGQPLLAKLPASHGLRLDRVRDVDAVPLGDGLPGLACRESLDEANEAQCRGTFRFFRLSRGGLAKKRPRDLDPGDELRLPELVLFLLEAMEVVEAALQNVERVENSKAVGRFSAEHGSGPDIVTRAPHLVEDIDVVDLLVRQLFDRLSHE